MAIAPFLTRVKVRNFKSIGSCDVNLGRFTVLVGRNGAGKSNFVDALRFVLDALQTSLDHAIKSRGGIESVRRRSTGHPRNFAIELDFRIDESRVDTYGFEISARPNGGYAVKTERLIARNPATGAVHASYTIEDAQVSSSVDHLPPASRDRLSLVAASGLQEFRPAYDALLSMGFYNLNPDAMKEVQNPDAGELLHRDGANIAGVVARLKRESPETMTRIHDYLSRIVPGIQDFDRVPLGPKETLQFKQEVQGSRYPWQFYATSMSDGTLRALGALVAVGQIGTVTQRVSLVGIEEPETALHPAAAGALMDALSEASESTQVLVTSHSPDPASRKSIQDHLHTAGELLRMDQLEPDAVDVARQEQLSLFSSREEG